MHPTLEWCAAIVLIFGLSSVLTTATALSIQPRIIGGYDNFVEKEPHMIQVLIADKPICGGSLLTSLWAVTAAHCVFSNEGNPAIFSVRGGSSYLSGGVVHLVESVHTHPKYTRAKMVFDIGLLKLQTPMIGENIKPIQLCSAQAPPKSSVKVSGWGKVANDSEPSYQLQSVQLTRISAKTCKKRIKSALFKTTSPMICTDQVGKSFCTGDSGGPLVYKRKLCGIVSWSKGCGKGSPGVYTDVVKATPFINRIMKSF